MSFNVRDKALFHVNGKASITQCARVLLGPLPMSPVNRVTLFPGPKFLDKIASLTQHSGQNGIILVFYVFPL